MSGRGRPKKNNDVVSLWVVEQYYHGDDLTQSWGKPIEICHSEQEAKECMELNASLYASEIECPEINEELSKMIIVRPNNGTSFYPAMDFWYYQCLLVEED